MLILSHGDLQREEVDQKKLRKDANKMLRQQESVPPLDGPSHERLSHTNRTLRFCKLTQSDQHKHLR